MMGKSDKDVLRLLTSDGGVRDLGVEPILRAINAQVGGGKAGDAAIAKAQRNISSLIEQVKNIPSNLLFDLEVGPGIDKIKDALREVIKFFDSTSDTGQEVRAVLAGVFNALVEGFLGVDISGDAADMGGMLKKLLANLKESTPEIKEFAAGVRTIAGAIASLAVWLPKLGGIAIPIGTGQVSALGDAYMHLASQARDGASGVLASIAGLGSTIASGASALLTSATSLGSAIIDGLVSGISGGLSAVVSAIKGVASGAIDTAKGVLGIASPSKVFGEIGTFTSLGYAQGIANDNGAVDKALRGLLAPTQLPSLAPSNTNAGQAAASAVAGAALGSGPPAGVAGGLVINVEAGAVVIQMAPGAGGADIDLAIERAAERLAARMLEKMAMELGLAPRAA